MHRRSSSRRRWRAWSPSSWGDDAPMKDRTLRGKVVLAGIGETTYYKHGQSPTSEFQLALEAILNACADAGVGPREIDGFSSYSNEDRKSTRLNSSHLGISY